jgi:hypothetical protein
MLPLLDAQHTHNLTGNIAESAHTNTLANTRAAYPNTKDNKNNHSIRTHTHTHNLTSNPLHPHKLMSTIATSALKQAARILAASAHKRKLTGVIAAPHTHTHTHVRTHHILTTHTPHIKK